MYEDQKRKGNLKINSPKSKKKLDSRDLVVPVAQTDTQVLRICPPSLSNAAYHRRPGPFRVFFFSVAAYTSVSGRSRAPRLGRHDRALEALRAN